MKKKAFLYLFLLIALCFYINIPNAKAQATINRQVSASSDDLRYRSSPTEYFSITDTSSLCGYYSSTSYDWRSAFRFLNVTIPSGATIKNAFLKVTSNTGVYDQPVETKISCEDADNATTFSDQADYLGRSKTSSVVTWNIPLGAWLLDVEYTSPNIKSCVQDVVDRVGWSSTNTIVIFWDDNGTRGNYNLRYVYSYDGSDTKCAKLEIEYWFPCYVTFNFSVGGQFRVNNLTIANSTTTVYDNGTVLELVAVVKNSSYVFQNFTWDSNNNLENPYNFTVINSTLWCYFCSTPEGEAPIRPYCVFIGHNSSLGGNASFLYAHLKTDSGTLSYALWCHNNTGSYVNGSWIGLSGSEDDINLTISLGTDYDDTIGFKVYMNNSLGNYGESKTFYLFGVDDPPIKEANLIPFLFVGASVVFGLIGFVFILSRRKKK